MFSVLPPGRVNMRIFAWRWSGAHSSRFAYIRMCGNAWDGWLVPIEVLIDDQIDSAVTAGLTTTP